jgi:hypothetical protein
LPIACDGHWTVERPIYFVADDELRRALATALPRCRFWSPPCNIRDLPSLVSMIGVIIGNPVVQVTGDRARAMECGDGRANALSGRSTTFRMNSPAMMLQHATGSRSAGNA